MVYLSFMTVILVVGLKYQLNSNETMKNVYHRYSLVT